MSETQRLAILRRAQARLTRVENSVIALEEAIQCAKLGNRRRTRRVAA